MWPFKARPESEISGHQDEINKAIDKLNRELEQQRAAEKARPVVKKSCCGGSW